MFAYLVWCIQGKWDYPVLEAERVILQEEVVSSGIWRVKWVGIKLQQKQKLGGRGLCLKYGLEKKYRLLTKFRNKMITFQ